MAVVVSIVIIAISTITKIEIGVSSGRRRYSATVMQLRIDTIRLIWHFIKVDDIAEDSKHLRFLNLYFAIYLHT
jgi:hypothetical protein